MVNPFDPSVWVKAFFDYILSIWSTGSGQSFVNAIQLLMVAPWPSFTDSFMSVWNSAFGLSLMIAVIVLAINGIITAINYRHDGWIGALKNVGWVLLNGTGLVVVIWVTMFIVDSINRVIAEFTNFAVNSDVWSKPYETFFGAGGGAGVDMLDKMGITWLGMAIGKVLQFNAQFLQFSLIFFMLLYLIGSSLGTGLISKIFRSAIVAALITILFARVVQIAILSLGAIALNILDMGPVPTPFTAYMMLTAGGLAASVPFVMWTVIFIVRLLKERRIDPVAMEKERSEKVVTEQNREEVASSRSRNLLAGTKAEAAEFGTSALRAAGHAAAAFGITKLAAMATAKATGAIPEGYSKIITATAASIGFLAAYGERKAHQQVDKYSDRIGRPGASRARDISREG